MESECEDQSRAVSDSSINSTCCDSSLSLPSSVHVADVTHGTCVALEHPASHGVSATANETNVNCGIISGDTEGMSCTATVPSVLSSRKRQAESRDNCMPASSRSKRGYKQSSSNAITSIIGLREYLEEMSEVTNQSIVGDDFNIKKTVDKGK